jgi:hypothetical protein
MKSVFNFIRLECLQLPSRKSQNAAAARNTREGGLPVLGMSALWENMRNAARKITPNKVLRLLTSLRANSTRATLLLTNYADLVLIAQSGTAGAKRSSPAKLGLNSQQRKALVGEYELQTPQRWPLPFSPDQTPTVKGRATLPTPTRIETVAA